MVNSVWSLDEAIERFSEMIEKALKEGPQTITRNNEDVAVIVSKADYQRLKKSKTSLVAFFRRSPLVGIELDLERDQN